MKKNNLKHATLCFLIRDSQILLATKKRGFGTGKLNGVGGKQHPDETIQQTAVREAQEEIGVKIHTLRHVATLDFYYTHKPEWDQQVHVFIATEWGGEPTESEEMKPQWFKIEEIPFDQMWPDDKIWLPLVLQNKKVKAELHFAENDQLVKYAFM